MIFGISDSFLTDIYLISKTARFYTRLGRRLPVHDDLEKSGAMPQNAWRNFAPQPKRLTIVWKEFSD
jgi:hypothetical protein